MTDEKRIKDLLHEGLHREAAALLIEAGELERAMEAFAAVWDYERAASVALEAGDLPSALDYLIRGGNRAKVAEVRAKLSKASSEVAERAVDVLMERGERDQAARLLESRGDLIRAAELVKSLGEARRAAALLERAGQLREAGRLYERLVEEDPNDRASALSLGTILRRFGKHELSARMLQVAAKDERCRRPALRGLVVALHGLGLQDAASSALEELLEEDGSAPRTVEALVAAEQEAERSTTAAEEEGRWVGGRYQVIRVLGGGAAGRVYLARDALYEREVALKVLAAGTGGTAGRDAFSRFAREAQIAAKLDHPNIVRVLEFDDSSGVLVMEYLGGGTLADRVGQGPAPLAMVREALFGVLAALETAHLRGVVHRDVKPQNVLFTRGGGVKLVDFGVAHLQDLGLTQTGAFIGTLTYMAPEQITGDKVSAGTDLYGLGSTIFHALCGRPPFVGADLVREHLAEEPPLPSVVRPALGTRFDALLKKLLAKVSEDRFASAAEVRRAAQKIDFAEPDEEVVDAAPPPEPIEPEQEEAFVGFEPEVPVAGGMARHARHRALDVAVTVRSLEDHDELRRLADLGRAVSPFLQSVFDVEESEAVVEEPEDQLLSDRLGASGPLEPSDALKLVDQIARGVEALHAADLIHGSISPESVTTGRYQAMLLLPKTLSSVSMAEDVAAVERLLASALGSTGPALESSVVSGPLAEALGQRRSEQLASSLPETRDIETFRGHIASIQIALEGRRQAREHIHALAAAARAAGDDPHEGLIATFLDERSEELDV